MLIIITIYIIAGVIFNIIILYNYFSDLIKSNHVITFNTRFCLLLYYLLITK